MLLVPPARGSRVGARLPIVARVLPPPSLERSACSHSARQPPSACSVERRNNRGSSIGVGGADGAVGSRPLYSVAVVVVRRRLRAHALIQHQINGRMLL